QGSAIGLVTTRRDLCLRSCKNACMSGKESFDAVIGPSERGSAFVTLPFDPDEVWGKKSVHHVSGRIGPCETRGPLVRKSGAFALKLGPAWLRDRPVRPGQKVRVVLWPEGPQRGELDADIAAALDAAPKAAAFFDGLAQFYRRGYLTWIDATKRRPDERMRRIREVIRFLRAGMKERPR
ncbi:MAG TPA: YdeI/OmpD-associated family protein, partial [Planctomycetota bacterium]|nr:YdeI/OmpD-associated family protein [Planctomycetota bacterium]